MGFHEDERYLVFARGGGVEGAPLSTNICSGTKPLNNAEADLRTLGPGESPPSEHVELADPVPVSDTGGDILMVLIESVIILLLAAVTGFVFWRRRRPG